MRNETRRIVGPDDFELGHPREGLLEYTVSWSGKGTAKGLVFLISGFGGDADPEYARKLRRHMVDVHGLVAVSVRYHCSRSRPEVGASVRIDAREQILLAGLAAMHGRPVSNPNDIGELAAKLAGLPEVMAYGEIVPGGGEYQNFGVLQAMDHLAVLGDLLARGPAFDRQRIIAFGSSHGGYIAHLMAKLAPSTFAAVIDNSAYAQPPIHYLGAGRGAEYTCSVGGTLQLHCRTLSGWSFDERGAPNFYGRDNDVLRDAAHPPHLEAMRAAAQGDPTQYLMVISAEDHISPPEAKRRQAAALRQAGFDARLELIGPDQIDGVVFKAPVHGLGASLRGLFDRMAPLIAEGERRLDVEAGSEVVYRCVDRAYRFVHGGREPWVRGEMFDLYPLAEPAVPAAAAA